MKASGTWTTERETAEGTRYGLMDHYTRVTGGMTKQMEGEG